MKPGLQDAIWTGHMARQLMQANDQILLRGSGA